ncbi:WD40 repeat-like protein [Laetiporus sulphureus 93-53]|uniref:Pre-rRNA-processing protein IPI3 n=1 Tax=Laetiporus sulphureus 93-53 TaxID=1314785 RepID=A0A165GA05_9APHY|nr:WD40 repeat-like protein [Laetiporus sulphureus 93-53]KZT10047.1 WD40 repeat-like protein [Laetiporus sulphureus 93-53]
MQLHECILCATAPSSSTPGPGTISFHDIQTGSALASFKQTSASTHCTAVVQSSDGHGGFMLAAQPDKSILNVYNFQKDQLALKIVLPEKLSAIAMDPGGKYCAGGTSHGRIFLWEIASGIMFNAWDAHYRRVSVLRFTHDGAALLSGSEDSGVTVWVMSRLLDDDLQNEPPTSYCLLSDHTLPVTDIICGIGRFPTCRVLSASTDHSVKLWDLSSKSLLSTFYFPEPITCLAWDATERLFFAASANGSIHQVNLFRQREDKFGHLAMEAIGGGGVSDAIRVNEQDPEGAKKRLIAVGQPVTVMTISLTSSLLLVGTATGLIQTYDIASHQLLRTLTMHKGLKITHMMALLRPPDLVGHVSLSLATGMETKEMVVRPVAPFQRMRDAKPREAHEVLVMLPPQSAAHAETFFSYSREEMLRDHAYFMQGSTSGSGSSTNISVQSRVTELEGEIAKLREQLGKAKSINDTMWETVVKCLVAGVDQDKQYESNDNDGKEDDESGRRRKRGRV